MRWCQGLILTVITLQAGCLLAVAAGEARRNEEDKERLREVGQFMTKYKYLEDLTPPNQLVASQGDRQRSSETTTTPSKKRVMSKLSQLQHYLRVPVSGRIDEATVEAMQRPRCGRPDPDIAELNDLENEDVNDAEEQANVGRGRRKPKRRRQKRYALAGDRWSKKHISYRIDNYPTSVWIPRRRVQDSIARALQMWGDVTPLDFRMLDDWDIDDEDADIYVSFSKYRHGDPYPFDGPDGTIAHAYLPNGQFGNLDGDVHFDDSEFFSYDGDSGYNLFKVAAHELGHSLGLEHSHTMGSIMVPDYAGFKGDDNEFKLGDDDIRAIQVLYGSLQWYIRKWTTNGKEIHGKGKKHLYHERGHMLWTYKGKTLLPGYPRSVRSRNMPGHVDAALHFRAYNKTYFFRGPYVWRYDEKREYVDAGFPTLTKEVFPGIQTPLDAAFQFTDKNHYFVQRKKYQKYSTEHRNADPGYPRYFGEDFIMCTTTKNNKNSD
eukprot:XP_011667311.1 PREDICTED: matrix metalloproteinase-14 [Strongylocentrotus purpuratus]